MAPASSGSAPTLCGNVPDESKRDNAHLSTLNSYFFDDIPTVIRFAYGLSRDGDRLTIATQRLIEENYEKDSWQARQVRLHAVKANFQSSMRMKVIHSGQCVGYVCLDSNLKAFGLSDYIDHTELEAQEKRLSRMLKPLVRMMAPAIAQLRDLRIKEFEDDPQLEPDFE